MGFIYECERHMITLNARRAAKAFNYESRFQSFGNFDLWDAPYLAPVSHDSHLTKTNSCCSLQCVSCKYFWQVAEIYIFNSV